MVKNSRFIWGVLFGAFLSTASVATAATAAWLQKGNNLYFNGGNVGIGTSAPGAALDITSTRDASGAVNTGALQIGKTMRFDQTEIITNTGTALLLQHNNNGDLRVDYSTFMVDASTNRVGIGTTAPASTLDVNGDLSVRSDLTIRGVIRPNANGDVIIRLGN